jgi:(R,R)-butanediol dehydrogenase / meso-butanediol dehydrogenase / diacetyl reductase
MKGAYYVGKGAFEVREGEIVRPAPGQVRVEVAYCGVCGSDLHVFRGHLDNRVRAPQVIGHEASGTVAEVGDGVEGFAAGDRVVVRPVDYGPPDPVDNGYPTLGKHMRLIGMEVPGALQGSWTVPAHALHHLPDDVSLRQGALVEPIAVACHVMRIGEVKAGEKAVVIGGGPIGLLVALVARHNGAQVILSEVNDHRVDFASSFGLATTNPKREDLDDVVRRFSGGAYADVVFEASGTAAGAAAMMGLARVHGRVVVVGMHPEPREVDLLRVFARELRVFGARIYEPVDFEEAIALVREGSIPFERLVTEVAPLDDVQRVFETLDASPEGMKFLIR